MPKEFQDLPHYQRRSPVMPSRLVMAALWLTMAAVLLAVGLTS